MSAAASALLRELIARAGVPQNRILLTDVRSIDWQSLTFIGERHELHLRIAPPRSADIGRRMCENLEDADFNIPGHIVADVAVRAGPEKSVDGSTLLTVEALTIQE